MHHNAFSCYDAIRELLQKVSWQAKSVFFQNGVLICSRSLFRSDVFLLMKLECASLVTQLFKFYKEILRDFLGKKI